MVGHRENRPRRGEWSGPCSLDASSQAWSRALSARAVRAAVMVTWKGGEVKGGEGGSVMRFEQKAPVLV
jgi:hypothetical protein